MRRLLGGLAAALAVACGSPASPAVTAPLGAGKFLIEISGDTIACGDLATPQAGTHLFSSLIATVDADGTWIAKSATAADGTLEIRLRRTTESTTAPASPAGVAVTGTISGIANYSVDPAAPVGTVNSYNQGHSASAVANTATAGKVHAATFASGYVNGSFTFTGPQRSVTCPSGRASWLLNGPS